MEIPRKAGIRTGAVNGYTVEISPLPPLAVVVSYVSVSRPPNRPGSVSVFAEGSGSDLLAHGALRLADRPPVEGIYDCLLLAGSGGINVIRFPEDEPDGSFAAQLVFPMPAGFRGVRVIAETNTLTGLLP
jgi:hypothetical protein